MDQGAQDGIIEPETRFGARTTSLTGTAGGHSFAVTGPAPAATTDGVAVLHAAGPHLAYVQGVANICGWRAGA
jgi:hypothetical protein